MYTDNPDALISRFYELYSFPVNRPLDQRGLGELFWPAARMRSAITMEGNEEVLDLTALEFLEQIASLVATQHARGVPMIRRELSRRVDQYGTMAQVWSVYTATMGPEGAELRGRAVFGFQLLQAKGRWWICDLVGYTERPHEPIPEKYLAKAPDQR